MKIKLLSSKLTREGFHINEKQPNTGKHVFHTKPKCMFPRPLRRILYIRLTVKQVLQSFK